MLSFGKSLTTFPCQLPRAFQYRGANPSLVIRNSNEEGRNVDGDNSNTSPIVQPPITPPRTVQVRFKRGSRRKKKLEQEGNASNNLSSMPKLPPKDWNSMTLTEKATELYVGEKGLLFWLNKFAYASIFIVIGGWIVFRFVGPALNLYQLDTPPLAPTSLLRTSFE